MDEHHTQWLDSLPPTPVDTLQALTANAADASLQMRDAVQDATARLANIQGQIVPMLAAQADASKRIEAALLHVRILLFAIALLLFAR
jgi:hypothetical protein